MSAWCPGSRKHWAALDNESIPGLVEFLCDACGAWLHNQYVAPGGILRDHYPGGRMWPTAAGMEAV